MRQIKGLFIIVLAISMTSCGSHRGGANQLTHEDSVRVINDRNYQLHLAELQKVRENFIGPTVEAGEAVTKGDKFKTNVMDDSIAAITAGFEKLNVRLDHAQKDSTTIYGALLTRFRLLKTQHKYLTGTYTDDAHLLRFTSEVTFDDKHEEDMDFYFNNSDLISFRERHTTTREEQDIMTEDCYFLHNGRVVYAYRDEGIAVDSKDRINVMSMKRYLLRGDLTAHVSKMFANFKSDYEILLNQPLEPLIYPGEAKAQ